MMGHKLASYGPIDDKIARELKSLDATLMAQVDAILRKQLHAMTFFNNLLEERMRSFRPSPGNGSCVPPIVPQMGRRSLAIEP